MLNVCIIYVILNTSTRLKVSVCLKSCFMLLKGSNLVRNKLVLEINPSEVLFDLFNLACLLFMADELTDSSSLNTFLSRS